MPTRQQLETALFNADKAGDTEAAKTLANAIKAGNFNDIPNSNVNPDLNISDTGDKQSQIKDENLYKDVISLKEVDEAFKKIPGVKTLSEFAAGANRSVAGFLDFIGPDNVNAVLALAGSDKRVPTFGELVPERGSFDQGLSGEIAASAGELVPAALGIGQGLKTAASNLPKIQAGESAGTGVARQLGSSTPKQDVVGAVAAGAGGEIGREVGGEDGALVGSVLAPVALAAIPINAAKNQASKLLSKSAPTIDKLKDTARGIYKSLDESGITVPAQNFDKLADDVFSTLTKEGSDQILTPKAARVAERFLEEKGSTKAISKLDTLRKVAQTAAESNDASDRRLGQIAIDKIDDFMDNIGGEVIGDKKVGEAYRAARALWQKVKKSETLETAVKQAEAGASGFENGLRNEFRAIRKKIVTGKLKGYTEEEKAAISKVVEGTKAGNIARFLGKFGIMDGITSRSLTTLSGAGLAGGAGTLAGGVGVGGIAASVVPLVGQVSGALAQRMTLNNAKMAQNIVKAGKNWNAIANIYAKNTPKAQQSARELAELFIVNKVPINNISLKSAQPLISDAAIIAAIAKHNDDKEQTK